jgi:hypothetical protein
LQHYAVRRLEYYSKATEDVPWMVGMTVLEASHTVFTVIIPSSPSHLVSYQPALILAANEGYHATISLNRQSVRLQENALEGEA